ncbi:MAG: SRPBCC domain-containing protein [Flavobacteriales bacterium]|nr:SRPBCC domain-containing protein [Flavobacteriales bacterium]
MDKITVSCIIAATPSKVWEYYTSPEHIVNWNFADPSWCCPSATNDMSIGGVYNARIEARDGSFGFDFKAIYTEIEIGSSFSYGFADRSVDVSITPDGENTLIEVTFDPESENPIEMQRNGWQAILENFKTYTESN